MLQRAVWEQGTGRLTLHPLEPHQSSTDGSGQSTEEPVQKNAHKLDWSITLASLCFIGNKPKYKSHQNTDPRGASWSVRLPTVAPLSQSAGSEPCWLRCLPLQPHIWNTNAQFQFLTENIWVGRPVWRRSPDSQSVVCISSRAEHQHDGGGWQQTGDHAHKQIIVQPQQLPQSQRLLPARGHPAGQGSEGNSRDINSGITLKYKVCINVLSTTSDSFVQLASYHVCHQVRDKKTHSEESKIFDFHSICSYVSFASQQNRNIEKVETICWLELPEGFLKN